MNITTINSIEISSVCDNACQYCPAKDQHRYRETGFMTMETFGKVIDWVKVFIKNGTQKEINLFGCGEPTLNPHVVEMVHVARQRLPFRQVLHLNTNGKTMTRELAADLKHAGISHIDLTLHNSYDAAKTIKIFREVGIEGKLSIDPIMRPNNWAGQVDWFVPDYCAGPCPWLANGQIMVMSNGNISHCCIDAFWTGKLGNINDDLTKIDMQPMELCKGCHHSIEEK